ARQQYVGQLITFFEKQIAASIKRGPLARMTIGKTSARIDAVELDSVRRPAAAMIERIVDRSSQAAEIDPAVFGASPVLYERMRMLHQHAGLYKRDTGIDGLYLGFPFLIFQPAGAGVQPRIAPVLLWPVRIGAEVSGHRFTIAFDGEREEVRLNPALEAFMGREEAQKWEEARAEGLGRSARLGTVLDAFGHLATVRQHELVRLPAEGVAVPPGSGELVCAAVLFHAAFMGQAVLEDLGRLKHARLDDTALETALRIAGEPQEETTPAPPREVDRYLTMASDPSQEAAVLSARRGRGLVVEGPPGTGKSQTIVNLVADAIGRKRTLLLVCQKHAALEVVRKRLEAEDLGNRMVMVTDVNKDRRAVVGAVRDQVEEILTSQTRSGQVATERARVAARIEALEQDIDTHHRALHALDPASGRSYRDLIGELVALDEGERPPIDCLALREVVAGFDLAELAAVEEACAPLGGDWLAAGYEGSPLIALNPFAWDVATCGACARDVYTFRQAEAERARLLQAEFVPFKVRALKDADLDHWIGRVDIARSEPSFLSRLLLRRVRARMRLRSHFARVGAKLSETGVQDFHVALKSEKSLRAAVAGARAASLAALERLTRWLTPAWADESRTAIEEGRPNGARIEALVQALPRLAAFQRFRARAQGLTPQTWACYAALRESAEALARLPPDALDPEIRRILNREARLAWKARPETTQPVLLFDRAQIEGKVKALAEADAEMRGLNKRALIEDIDTARLGTRQQWHDISRLQGPQMLSLRQFVERGADIGLFQLRPVWLMNPDVASRLLPLRPGMFDVVVYDEASQMPVECALPTLFRGKTVIVSGDEKQLPPTSFFATRVESDENDSFDDESGLEVPEEVEAVWNRRDIEDCSDLLALGRSVLPPTMLEVHYRSQFRELIAYSNAAFYSNRLQVPIQHPDSKIVEEKPIHVVRVDGVYTAQTNSDEADEVVKILARYWRTGRRPSIGVVTFNRKQADLIQARLEARARSNQRFRSVYAQELGRNENGEDMGFFVKNVENVQGDERDVIVFSTTFGRDRAGGFRRNFGVLGQKGGERRLNVAISRARQKVIVVTSMPVSEVSDMLLSSRSPSIPRDYLQGYLHYAEQVSRGSLGAARSALNQAAGKATAR
ncbi:MAG: AAA domain-containing protein, partial [Hyphomicrobiaceae bacterium]